MSEKTHHHCKVAGCMEVGAFQPHDEFPNVLFCERHAEQLIKATVRSIIDGTHPALADCDD